MGIRLGGMGVEIIEIEIICAITNADSEGEELVVLGGGGVNGFLGSLGEASVTSGALLRMGQILKPMGLGEEVGENGIREKARFAT